MPDTQSWKAVLTVVGAVYGGVRRHLEHTVMEIFLIVLAAIAGTGVAFAGAIAEAGSSGRVDFPVLRHRSFV
jgi:hypothetical protein